MYVYDVTSKTNNIILFTMILYDKKMKDKWLKEIRKKEKIVNIIFRKVEYKNDESV